MVASLALACHAQQKFPASSIHNAETEFFEATASDLDDEPTETDLSALNDAPAGAHGFVSAVDGHFVDDRGSAYRLRFFGLNLSGRACLPDPVTGERLARHLRKLGFNAVRLHGLDGAGLLLNPDGQLNPDATDRLDAFTAALKAQGIYFSFGLHASGAYPGLEGEALKRFPRGQVLDRFYPPFLEAQRRAAQLLLRHENSRTHVTYGAEPALLYLELSHEDTIFPSSAGSPDDAPASYRAELAKGYREFLASRTAEGKRAPGPADEEAAPELPTFQSSASRRADYAQYLAERERAAVRELAHFVRNELKLRSMLVNSQVSFGGLPGVLREAEISDFIDVHGYWDRPRSTAGSSAAEPRWAIENTSQIGAPNAGTLGVLASYRVFGKPFVVSEYASPSSNDYAAELFPLLVGVASLQDWDGVFAFTYADRTRDDAAAGLDGRFDLAGDPVQLALVTAAARAFRTGMVAKARSRVELSVPEEPSALAFDENALPSLWSEQGVPASVAAIHQLGITLRPGAGAVRSSGPVPVDGVLGSDTGELLWASQGPHARFSIDAPALKLVCGLLSHSKLQFAGVVFEFPEFTPGFACASLVSLDAQPIASATHLLLNVVGRAQNAHRSLPVDVQAAPARMGPVLVQYVPITVRLPRADWRVSACSSTGAPLRALPVVQTSDSSITTTRQGASLSYAISR